MLDISVLSYNKPEFLKRCTDCLSSQSFQDFHLYVSDQGSKPDLKSVFDNIQHEQKTYIYNEDNPSFSIANNNAAGLGEGKYILFLNDDCYLDKDALKYMVESFEEDDEIGVVGCKLLYPDGKVQHCRVTINLAARCDHIYRHYHKDHTLVNYRGICEAVTGACLMTRRYLWESVGGLPEIYAPGGFEDIDYCLMLRELGYHCFYEPRAWGWHAESQTFGDNPNKRKEYVKNQVDNLFPIFRDRWLYKLYKLPM